MCYGRSFTTVPQSCPIDTVDGNKYCEACRNLNIECLGYYGKGYPPSLKVGLVLGLPYVDVRQFSDTGQESEGRVHC